VIHVVGFDVSDPKEREQLQAIATVGRGKLLQRDRRPATRRRPCVARCAAPSIWFTMRPARGVVARGYVNGPPLDLERGTYRLTIPRDEGRSGGGCGVGGGENWGKCRWMRRGKLTVRE